MAEVWNTLKNVRVKLADPIGSVNLDHVDNYAGLPIEPASQTQYRTDDTGVYYKINPGNLYEAVELRISDDILNSLIGTYGEFGAVKRAIPIIMAGVLNEMQAVRMKNGTEDIQYQSLSEILNFYKVLKDAYQEEEASNNNYGTGRKIYVERPIIGGY